MAVSEDQNQQETSHSVDESELEQYGVWVKAGPEDVVEAEAEDQTFSLSDLGDSELTGGDSESYPSTDDEQTPDLGPVDESLPEISEETLETVLEDHLEEELEEITLEPIEEDSPEFDAAELENDEIEELILEEDNEVETESGELDMLTLEEDDVTIDIGGSEEDLGDLEEELTLEEIEPAEETAPSSAPESRDEGVVDSDLNIEEELPDDLDDLTLDLDELDVDSFQEPTSGASEEPEEMEEIVEETIEEELAEEPEELPVSEAETSEEMEIDLESFPEEKEDDEEEFEEITPADLVQEDEELPELESGDEEVAELAIEDFGDDEVTELTLDEAFEPEGLPEEGPEDFTEDLLSVDEEPEGDLLEEIDIEENLLAESEMEAHVPVEPGETPEPLVETEEPFAQPGGDRSLSLLESIERELASIRDELGDLKRELGQLRGQPAPAAEASASPEEEAGGGFFEGSEDEDETIALTGQELDNILNTAEFTEETGQPTEVDDLLGLVPEEDLGEEEDTPVTEISLEEPPEESDALEIDLESTSTESLTGSDEEVEALASMDIDAELADIEELEDTSDDFAMDTGSELEDLDFTDAEAQSDDDEPILDAEPLDSEPIEDLAPSPPEAEDLSVAPPLPSELDLPGPTNASSEADTSDTLLPENLKGELRSVLSYMDQLLESLPEEKIQEFARSEHFTVYRRLFEELGLEQ